MSRYNGKKYRLWSTELLDIQGVIANLHLNIRNMKSLLVISLVLFCQLSCKEAIQKIKEDMVVKAMIDGQWAVTNFTQNGTNITDQFTGYRFKYYQNKTVDAILNGSVQMTGTWDGQESTRTTWASFISAPSPLVLINGSWHIDDSGWTYVVATQTNGSEVKTMRLDKQP